MEKAHFGKQIYLLSTLFIAYCFVVLFQLENAADIFSVVILLVSFAIIYYSLIDNNKTKKYAESWFKKYTHAWRFLALSILWWAIVDILWAVYAIIFKKNPEEIELFLYLYTVPNILMATAAVVFLINQRRRWNFFILLLDSAVTAIVSAGSIWLLFFRTLEPTSNLLDPIIISTSIYIISDAVVITCIFIWFLSIRVKKAPLSGHLIAISALVYSLTDLVYGYALVENLYIPNTMIDVLYMLYVLLISAGISTASRQNVHALPPIKTEENLKTNRKVLFLLLVPFIVMIITRFDLAIILLLNSVIVIHQLISAVLLNRSRQEAIKMAEDKYRQQLERTVDEKTIELINSNKELSRIAREDSVTGLDNRSYFINELNKSIENIDSGSQNGQIILFCMDIDNFRSINDIYGHETGDMLLKAVSLKLKELHHDEGTLARLGGDEFVMSFCSNDNYSAVEAKAKQIISSFSKPIITGEYIFNTSLSIGIAIYPQDGKDLTELLKNADLSMYYAKEQAHESYIFYSEVPKSQVYRKNDISLKLRNAIYDREFELHYQPHIKISNGSLIGAEALLRWNQPDLGSISPAEFIPIAESNGEIEKLATGSCTKQ